MCTPAFSPTTTPPTGSLNGCPSSRPASWQRWNHRFPAEPTGPFIRPNYSGPNPGTYPEAARIIGRTLEKTNS
ncbi:hypothetical protein DXT87_16015 [Arthrobacter sp. AET 35A]|nr:hypothetical protein [Arthrobacter sp. AET 35A]